MSLPIIFIAITLFLSVFIQFGSKLSAKNSLSWWLIFLFILVSALDPNLLRPLANLLGIHLASNFFLAVMNVFLLIQVIELSYFKTAQARQMRDFVSSMAAKPYTEMHKKQDTTTQRVLLLLPCFNEEISLPLMFTRLSALKSASSLHIDFCFIDDGSADLSGEILEKIHPEWSTFHAVNVGVGGALMTGFKILKRAQYDFMVQCDSDGQHPVELIPSFVEHAQKFKLDLLVGSRYSKSLPLEESQTEGFSSLESTTLMRRFGGFVIYFVLSLFGKSACISDPTSGFRVYSRQASLHLLANMPDDYPEPESIAILALGGFSLGEVRVRMAPRLAGESSLSGWKSFQYMVKVLTALIGLRLRTFLKR
jgi:hypothetical protein